MALFGVNKPRTPFKPWMRRGVLGALSIASLGAVAGGLGGCSHALHRDHGTYSEAERAARWEKGRDRAIERATKELALDSAQQAKLKNVADVMQAQRKAVMGEAKPRELMQALVAGDRFDRQGAQAFVQSRTEALRGASPDVIGALGDFYDSLKPEQQQKVRDFMARGPRHRWMG